MLEANMSWIKAAKAIVANTLLSFSNFASLITKRRQIAIQKVRREHKSCDEKDPLKNAQRYGGRHRAGNKCCEAVTKERNQLFSKLVQARRKNSETSKRST